MGREREESLPVDDAGAEGGEESLLVAEAALDEDLGAVVRDDVNTAELLHEHDEEGGLGGTTVAGDGEELGGAGPGGLGLDFFLEHEANVNVVQVAGGHEAGLAELGQGLESLLVAPLAHEPSRGFRGVIGHGADEDGWDGSRG